jgi:hypothetical protein
MAKKRARSKKPPAKTLEGGSTTPRATGAIEPQLDSVYRRVREILSGARNRAWQAVNATMVRAYWEVGRIIVEEEQVGKGRADYGKRILEGLASRLQAEFGKGFDRSDLRNMRAFFQTYPIRDAVRHE